MLEHGQEGPEEVLRRIEAHGSLWVRLAAVRTEDGWSESLLEIVAGERPPRWAEQRWEYDEVVFVGSERTGTDVATWLRTGRASVDGLQVTLPAVGEQVRWERRASQSVYSFELLPWPHLMYHLAPQSLEKGPGSGSMVGPAAPSFVRFANAAAAFFGVPLGPGGSFDHVSPTFREQDLSGRIAVVRYGMADVEIEVEGNCLGDAVVELAHDWPGPSSELSDRTTQAVRFEVAGGLPPGSWIVLKRAYGWVDRKFLNWPHTFTPDPGVEAIADAGTQLEALVLSGEGPQIEFKIELPSASKEARRKVARTVAAFANGEGGSILFGVRNEDGAVIGLPVTDVTQAAEDAVTNFVRSLVTPLPRYTLERHNLDDQPGRIVLVVNVERGASPPYGVDPANPQYYVRRGGTTFPASADEVRTLARSRPPVDKTGAYPYGILPT